MNHPRCDHLLVCSVFLEYVIYECSKLVGDLRVFHRLRYVWEIYLFWPILFRCRSNDTMKSTTNPFFCTHHICILGNKTVNVECSLVLLSKWAYKYEKKDRKRSKCRWPNTVISNFHWHRTNAISYTIIILSSIFFFSRTVCIVMV